MSAASPLEELLAQAATAWRGVAVPRADFLAYLAEWLPPGRSIEEAAPSLPLADSLPARACVRSEPGAIEAFDAAYRDGGPRLSSRCSRRGSMPPAGHHTGAGWGVQPGQLGLDLERR
jgi:hypothetical protein